MAEGALTPTPAPRTPLRWQSALVREMVPRTPTIRSFILAPSHPFAFQAGQHVDVRLTAPDGYQAQRSYSIASAPETPEHIELAIERLENGEVSAYFHDVAVVGDEIELRGPIGGHFVWSVGDPAPLLLVAGGSGIVPLLCMLRHRARQSALDPALLLFFARTWNDLAYRDELLAMHDADNGFQLALALTRGAPRRELDFGRRVDVAMANTVLERLPSPARAAFICGSNGFVEAASQALLAAGVASALIRTERYGG